MTRIVWPYGTTTQIAYTNHNHTKLKVAMQKKNIYQLFRHIICTNIPFSQLVETYCNNILLYTTTGRYIKV